MSEEVKQKILIVEDNVVSQDLFKRIAVEFGLDVHVNSDAEAGWEYFQNEEPRLIVLDWSLPGMNGVELCRKMRASHLGKYIVILMVTGHESPEDLEEALKSGVDFYMTKPVRREFFEAWLSVAEKRVQDLLELEKNDVKVAKFQEEIEAMNDQLEASINRANQMAMEAEKAYVEINQIFKTVAGGILLIDNECNILRHNEIFLEMARVSKDEATGKKCYEAFHSCLCNSPECPQQRIKNGEERVECQICREYEDGTKAHFNIVTTPFRGLADELIGVVEHISDITKRVEAEEALKESERRYKELSIVDELTGLFNKRHFNKTLELEIDRAKRYGHPLSLLIMDIDNFKHFNDTYGHAEGDKVLSKMGKIIAAGLRTNDMPSRYGGEEFTVILPATSGEDSVTVAERIRTTFAAEDFYPTPEEKVNKTISIGITQYADDEDKESLIKRADANLYQAKNEGKNKYVLK